MVNEAQSRVTSVGGRSGANAHRSAMRAVEAAGFSKAGAHIRPYQHPAF